MNKPKPYTLKSPCANCPFRSDIKFPLEYERVQDIKDSSYEDANFHCHKTVVYDDLDGQGSVGSKTRVCAGFLITMEKEGRANQPTRIAERIGLYDRTQLDMDAPTYPSMQDWVDSYAPEGCAADDGTEAEYCAVAGPNCTNPAGFSHGGDITGNPAPPVCTETCTHCQQALCTGCTETVEATTINGTTLETPVCIDCA